MEQNDSEFNLFTNEMLADFGEDRGLAATLEHKQANAKTIGMVVMGEKSFYENLTDTEAKAKHLPEKQNMPLLLENKLAAVFPGIKISQIIVGHEHGTKNFKCHYQICIIFEKESRITKKPFTFTSNEDFKFLGIFQIARNSSALQQYVKKEKDVNYLYPDKVITIKTKKGKKGKNSIDTFQTIADNRHNLTTEEAEQFILENDPKAMILYGEKIRQNLSVIVSKESDVPFEYIKPPSYVTDAYPLILTWFNHFCVDNTTRKKGLVLYSKERRLGKTRFAKSLVPSEENIVYFRGTFTAEAIKKIKVKKAKLLILDDMNLIANAQIETWKALIVSECTAIRDCYVNCTMDIPGLPCIVITNNEHQFINMCSQKAFRDEAFFVEINTYIGPPGTEPKKFDVHMSVSSELRSRIETQEHFNESKGI